VKWNDCAGEGVIDLRPYYRKAYKRNIPLKLFDKKKGGASRRKADAKPVEEAKAAEDNGSASSSAAPTSPILNPLQAISPKSVPTAASSGGGVSESKQAQDSDDEDPHEVDSDDDDGVGAISGNKQRVLSQV
jgi:hypothetical protein